MRKNGTYIILTVFLVVCLFGCKKKAQEVVATENTTASEPTRIELDVTQATETEPETEEEPTEPEERIQVDGKIQSYLTGEMVDVEKADRRPMAVILSNDKAAWPQYGINRAGVVYEAPVEGGMNRYLAILEDYDDLERIGSVRSCRTYYTYFAREFDAVCVHFGQSTFAVPYLKNVDHINGIEGLGGAAFYRTKDRKSPHNAYTSFEKLQSAMEKMGYSNTYGADYKGHYQFARNGEQVVLQNNAVDAFKVSPGYSINDPWFEYHEEDGLYHRYQHGKVHEGSEGPITVKNIIFQYCSMGHYATTDYLDIDVHTGQYGYYITNGKAVPLTWKKDEEFGVTHYYDFDNNEITLNQGKTWVCIISTRDFDKAKFQ